MVADVPLCRSHLQRITDALAGQPRTVVSGVVYYIGDRGTQTIKIGSTTRLLQRWAAICSARGKTTLQLLAIEPGYKELERQRHREFRRYRVSHHGGEREWYHRNDELIAHINQLRQEHGLPWRHDAVQATAQ